MNVVSLQTAQRLKELGWPQPDDPDSHYWIVWSDGRSVLAHWAALNWAPNQEACHAPDLLTVLESDWIRDDARNIGGQGKGLRGWMHFYYGEKPWSAEGFGAFETAAELVDTIVEAMSK